MFEYGDCGERKKHIGSSGLVVQQTVFVLHQDEGGIGPQIFPETQEISWGRSPREIWRAEGVDFPIPPEFWWSTDIFSASFFLQGVDQEILPCGQGRIDSVKINPSLLMMRECIRAPPRRESPREISRVEGNLEGGGDGFPNISRILVEHGYNLPWKSSVLLRNLFWILWGYDNLSSSAGKDWF